MPKLLGTSRRVALIVGVNLLLLASPVAMAQQDHSGRPLGSRYAPTTQTGPVSAIAAESQVIEGGKILARVNGEIVLAGEILPQVNEWFAKNGAQIPESQLPTLRRQAMQSALNQLIETKLLYSEFRRSVPEERMPDIEERLAERFDSLQLPKLLEGMNAASPAELDVKLRKIGSSIEGQRRAFGERAIAQQWFSQQIDRNVEISHTELLDYYQKHLPDYELESRARWEEIMVRFDRFATKQEAEQKICDLGNEVLIRRASLSEVAKKHSHGFTADEGGRHDWTAQGVLASKTMDRTLFGLPIGSLSPILEDKTGYHIIRVTEREEAGRTPFVEAQAKIRDTLRRENINSQMKSYLAKLRRNARVWTLFEGEKRPELGRQPDRNVRR